MSKEQYRPGDAPHNRRLLSEGTLSVARYEEDGSATWLPLVFGEGPLTPANGFHSQADVVIDARLAADLLRAPMDRPEDVQPSSTREKVWVVLTNNDKRRPEQVDRANPRPENEFGHIIEMTPPDGDHAAHVFRWDVLIRCGDPRVAAVEAVWHRDERARLVCLTRQLRGRCAGPPVGDDRSGEELGQVRQGRWPLRGRDRWRKAGPVAPLLPRARRRRTVRSLLHARRRDCVPRRSASWNRWGEGLEAVRAQLDLRGSGDAVAGFPADMPPRPAVVAVRKRGEARSRCDRFAAGSDRRRLAARVGSGRMEIDSFVPHRVSAV